MTKNIKIEDYNSRWNYMADRAGVSRHPVHGAEKTKIQIVGKFVGDWNDDLDYLLSTYHGGRGFNFLDKLPREVGDPYTKNLDIADMDTAGIPHDAKFVYKIGANMMDEALFNNKIPTIKKMIDWFGFVGKVLSKIHVQHPGQIFPFHFDDFTTHRNNSIDSNFVDSDPNRYARVEIQLKPWEYGHVWAVGNNYWSDWQAGEIMWHPWYDVPHGTANCGMGPRINLQITGETTPEVLEKLQRNNKDIFI